MSSPNSAQLDWYVACEIITRECGLDRSVYPDYSKLEVTFTIGRLADMVIAAREQVRAPWRPRT